MNNLPKIGETYNCFDDGKVSESRRYKVTVKNLIPFDKIDKDTLKLWEQEKTTCNWLYNDTTDLFVFCDSDSDHDEEVFVRDKNGGWFGISGFLCCGRLDINGDLSKILS